VSFASVTLFVASQRAFLLLFRYRLSPETLGYTLVCVCVCAYICTFIESRHIKMHPRVGSVAIFYSKKDTVKVFKIVSQYTCVYEGCV
jgi:hypothetical protein